MSDKFKGCTVVFEHDLSEEEVKIITNAIQMIKGVLRTEPSPSTPEDWMAEQRVRHELGNKIIKVVFPNWDK